MGWLLGFIIAGVTLFIFNSVAAFVFCVIVVLGFVVYQVWYDCAHDDGMYRLEDGEWKRNK